MASPKSPATDSHPESSSPPRCCYPSPHLDHDELPVVPSFLSQTRALTESSPQKSPAATFNPSVTPLSHVNPDVAKTGGCLENPIPSCPVVSLARFPSTATCVICVPTDVRTLQIPFDRDPEDTTDGLEFEHLTRRLITTYFIYFICGWGDGVTATVLPYFTADFHLNYVTSSLLFVTTTIGCLVGTIVLERTVKFLGRFYPSLDQGTYLPAVPFFRRLFTKNASATLPCGVGYSPAKARFSSLILAALLHPLFFIMMGTALNYSAVLLAYGIASLARALWTGSSNFYVASTPKKPLGVLLGWWCMGSFSAPFVCQTLMAKGIPWRHFYLGSLVLSAIGLSLIIFAFRPTRREFLADRKAALDAIQITAGALSSGTGTLVELQSSEQEKISDFSASRLDAPGTPNTLLRTLSMPSQWAFGVFLFIYGGSETLFQGYIVAYLLAERHFNPNTVGYVSSGFWLGMGTGRILWGYYCSGLTFTRRKYIIHASIGSSTRDTFLLLTTLTLIIISGVAVSMIILIFSVRSTIGNALSSAVVGLTYGPIFAGTLGLCNDVLPKEVRMVSMAIHTATSSVGSAVLPVLAGLILKVYGMRVFCFVLLAQTAAMFVLWIFLPSPPRLHVSGPA